MDWHAWHRDYEGETPLARRLVLVQARIGKVVAESRGPTIRVISMCVGDGRDILGALDGHPAASRIRGRLVELDRDLAETARATAARMRVALDVVEADAGTTDAYAGAVPADLLLACGVFGNISDHDVERTVRAMPMLLAPGGTVIWTRHRREPDLTPAIRSWFAESEFAELSFETVPDSLASVDVDRMAGTPIRFEPAKRLFTFIRTQLWRRTAAHPRLFHRGGRSGPIPRRTLRWCSSTRPPQTQPANDP